MQVQLTDDDLDLLEGWDRRVATYDERAGRLSWATLAPEAYRLLLEVDGDYGCVYCSKPRLAVPVGDPREITVDHIIARSRGGSHLLRNLQLVCRSCNSAKGDR